MVPPRAALPERRVQEIKTATELDLSNKGLGKLDAVVIVVLISEFCEVCKLQSRFVSCRPANGSLSKFTWSGEKRPRWNSGGVWQDAPPVTLDTTMTDADFSNKHLGVSGATILAAFISSRSMKDKGSLVSLNLAGNGLGLRKWILTLRKWILIIEIITTITEVLPKW